MLSRNDLHAYQERAVEFIKDKRRCALFLGLGLGKTVSTLTAISDMRDEFSISRVLIIAPLRVANSVWRQEAAQWDHLKHLDVAVATGTGRHRLAALYLKADITVINRENIPWLVKLLGAKWPFDAVVIDESSSVKNPSTARFKALKKILPKTDVMVLLTGTPAPNGLLDLWSQAYLIDLGERLGRTITGYRQRFFEADYFGRSFAPREGSDDSIHGLIADVCLSMSADDYLDMPDRIDLNHVVTLPPRTLTAYKDFERTMIAELPSGDEIEAVSAAVLAGKLMQNSNGFAYTNDAGSYEVLHDAKLDALAEIVDDNAGENMLVAYNFKADLERLKARFPQAVVLGKDEETIDQWNRGEIPMLLAHPASAGHGLNLQHGGSLCVWFGLNWSLELYLQFNARLHRQGQTMPVRVVHIVASDTIDARVAAVFQAKDATQRSLLSALKPKEI